MTDKTHDPAAVQDRLWDEIDKSHIGMLGLMGSSQHFQPMTAFLEREGPDLWFYSYKDTDLAEAAIAGGKAMFTFQLKDFHACVGGRLSVIHDEGRIEKYWNPLVSAWYADGKDDPRLTMLRLQCDDAEVWISEGGLTRFAWEVAKSNVTHRTPDVGGRTHLDFH